MDRNFGILLVVALSWACVKALEYDCNGHLSGLCRSPTTCSEEYSLLCPERGLCCPDSFETREDNLLRALPVSGCQNRKCLRYYKGWWSTTCGGRSRTILYCEAAKVYCCTSACRIQQGCVTRGGYCISNPTRCPGTVFSNLCKGVSCHCCVPDPTTTTPGPTVSTTTTTPQSTTTNTPLSTTTTPQPTTTQPTTTTTQPTTTTPQPTTTTTPQPTTTTTPQPTTTTTPQPTTTTALSCQEDSPTAGTCPASGEPGVACTCPSSCSEYGDTYSGEAMICPISNCPPVKVLCMEGYTKIIFRSSAAVQCDFKKDWVDYKKGFCYENQGEYWLGNENLYAMTDGKNHSMIMYGHNPADDSQRKLHYGTFSVGDESTNYQLTVGDFDGSSSNGADLFVDPTTNIILNGMPFSTRDRDNDNKDDGSCSTDQHEGGWWFNDCTGIKATQPNIDWYFWNHPTYEQGRLDEFYVMIKKNEHY